MDLETFKAGKSQVTLVAGVVPIAPHGGGGVPSKSVAFRGGDLYIRGGGAKICNLCLPFVVSQGDVLMILLYVLSELEEGAEDRRIGAVRAGVNLYMDNNFIF